MLIHRHSLRGILLQPQLTDSQRMALVQTFRPGRKSWKWLAEIALPDDLNPSSDPFLLALRRLVSKDFGELKATHRTMALRASTADFGLFHLALAEAAALRHPQEVPPFETDPAFRLCFSMLPNKMNPRLQPKLLEFRVRGLLEAVKRMIATGDPTHPIIVTGAAEEAKRATRDPELFATLLEVTALSLENWPVAKEELLEEALGLRVDAVDALLDHAVPDRVAEAMVDLADRLLRRDPADSNAALFYENARRRMAQLGAGLNLPLRRRLADR